MIVKDHLRLATLRSRRCSCRWCILSGDAQADLGEALAVIGGVSARGTYFALDLPHSNDCFVIPYPADFGVLNCMVTIRLHRITKSLLHGPGVESLVIDPGLCPGGPELVRLHDVIARSCSMSGASLQQHVCRQRWELIVILPRHCQPLRLMRERSLNYSAFVDLSDRYLGALQSWFAGREGRLLRTISSGVSILSLSSLADEQSSRASARSRPPTDQKFLTISQVAPTATVLPHKRENILRLKGHHDSP